MKLIKNAKLLTMESESYLDGGDMLIGGDGKIVSIGRELSQNGAELIDAKGLWAIPGIIDAHCHIGMWEDSLGFEGSDGNEATDPITPLLRAIDGINPEDRCFTEAREHGITCVSTGPGSANVIGGQFAALKTKYSRSVDELVIKEPLALKIAFGENPKTVYNSQKKTPSTRMATAALLRSALDGAAQYRDKLMKGKADPEKLPDRDLGKEVLVKALDGELIIKAHAHRADDIQTALRIMREFGLKMTIEHCTEGYRILDVLKSAGVRVILGPLLSDRSKPELSNLTFKAPYEFFKAGMRFALMTDHPVIPIHYLPVCAALAAREGLPEDEAIRCITLSAAEAIGLEDRLGSLKPGKDADFALYDANPLDFRAHVKMTFIDGEKVFEA